MNIDMIYPLTPDQARLVAENWDWFNRTQMEYVRGTGKDISYLRFEVIKELSRYEGHCYSNVWQLVQDKQKNYWLRHYECDSSD